MLRASSGEQRDRMRASLEAEPLAVPSRRRHTPSRLRSRSRAEGSLVSAVAIDRDRLVEWASRAIGTPSFTGDEQAMAELVRDTFLDMGLRVQWQQVEDGRANVLGVREGAGGGKSLMFNGHVDTSYSGREPWLAHVPGFQPQAFVEDGTPLRPRHLEHEGRARLLRRGAARARRRGDPTRGRPAGGRGRGRDREDAVGRRAGGGVPRLRGRLALPRVARRRRGHVHPRRADGVEGRARPLRVALAADLDPGPVRAHGVHRGAARGERDRAHARGARRSARLDPDVGGRPGERVPGREGDRQRRRIAGRLRLARLADASPSRPLPRRARAADQGDGDGADAGTRHGARPRRRAFPSTGSRARST